MEDIPNEEDVVKEMKAQWELLHKTFRSKLLNIASISHKYDSILLGDTKRQNLAMGQTKKSNGDQVPLSDHDDPKLQRFIQNDERLASMMRRAKKTTLHELKEEELSVAIDRYETAREDVRNLDSSKVVLQENLAALEQEHLRMSMAIHQMRDEENTLHTSLTRKVNQLVVEVEATKRLHASKVEISKQHAEQLHITLAKHGMAKDIKEQAESDVQQFNERKSELQGKIAAVRNRLHELWSIRPVDRETKRAVVTKLSALESQVNEIVQVKSLLSSSLRCVWCRKQAHVAYQTFPCQHVVCKQCAECFPDTAFTKQPQQGQNSLRTALPMEKQPEYALVKGVEASPSNRHVRRRIKVGQRQQGCIFCRQLLVMKRAAEEEAGARSTGMGACRPPCASEGVGQPCIFVPTAWADSIISRLHVASRDPYQSKALHLVTEIRKGIEALRTKQGVTQQSETKHADGNTQ